MKTIFIILTSVFFITPAWSQISGTWTGPGTYGFLGQLKNCQNLTIRLDFNGKDLEISENHFECDGSYNGTLLTGSFTIVGDAIYEGNNLIGEYKNNAFKFFLGHIEEDREFFISPYQGELIISDSKFINGELFLVIGRLLPDL